MRTRAGARLMFCLVLCFQASGLRAQEAAAKPAEESKEIKWGAAPYVYSGPDTGPGFGFSILYRDIFDKPGRDVTFSLSYTLRQYQSYDLDWSEPEFLSPHGRFHLCMAYETVPAVHYYGIGNDSDEGDVANWSRLRWRFEPQYLYRWPESKAGAFGLRVQLTFNYVDPGNGTLKDTSDSSYGSPVRRAYHRFYRGRFFDPANIVGLKIDLYRDTRVDRFPLGGGREEIVWPLRGGYEEISYERYDKAFGSDFSFQRFSVDARRFFPIYGQDTIVALRFKMHIGQGDMPFYQMTSLSGDDLRGYYDNRFLDLNSTQFNIELRQGFWPNRELPLFSGAIVLKYPSIFVYWDEGRVYHDYHDIADGLFEDYHWAWGFGFRFVVTPSVVVRFEWGNSEELGPDDLFYMTATLPF